MSDFQFNDATVGLKEMKSQCPQKLITSYLNINSIRNMFNALFGIVDNNVDVLMISETKVGNSFPTLQFFPHVLKLSWGKVNVCKDF